MASLRQPLLRLVRCGGLQQQQPTRLSSSGGRREMRYGHEEGHARKNEVRNEAWIRKKRNKHRSTGAAWRESVGLPPDPFKSHALTSRPDWCFKDGSPGYLTEAQSEAVDVMSQLCDDVRKALRLLDKKV